MGKLDTNPPSTKMGWRTRPGVPSTGAASPEGPSTWKGWKKKGIDMEARSSSAGLTSSGRAQYSAASSGRTTLRSPASSAATSRSSAFQRSCSGSGAPGGGARSSSWRRGSVSTPCSANTADIQVVNALPELTPRRRSTTRTSATSRPTVAAQHRSRKAPMGSPSRLPATTGPKSAATITAAATTRPPKPARRRNLKMREGMSPSSRVARSKRASSSTRRSDLASSLGPSAASSMATMAPAEAPPMCRKRRPACSSAQV